MRGGPQLDLTGHIRRLHSPPPYAGKWHLAVNVTISNFTPKPHTPFQWHTVSTAEFARKQAMLREALKALPQVKANLTSIKISAMEDFIGGWGGAGWGVSNLESNLNSNLEARTVHKRTHGAM